MIIALVFRVEEINGIVQSINRYLKERLIMKKMMVVAVLTLSLVLVSISAFATPLSYFSGWTQFADDDGVGANGFVDPGWGGQKFDAEYLFYKYDKGSNIFSIGLQTGFDVQHEPTSSDYKNPGYYAGDLALSFDCCDCTWEYGVNFTGTNVGLYAVTAWSDPIFFPQSTPYKISSGTLIGNSFTTSAGSEDNGELSYYRTASFSLSDIGYTTLPSLFAAHWTMSCGNDVIEGCDPIPEPQTLLLLGIGLLGLAFVGRKRLRERA